jgi:hypothetical protein
MATAKLSVRYDLPVPDLEVTEDGPFSTQVSGQILFSGMKPTKVTLRPSDGGFTLTIEVERNDPMAASVVADSYAAQLAEYLTFWFCDRITRAVVPRRLDAQFQGPDETTLHPFSGALAITGHAPAVRVTIRCSGKDIQGFLDSFSFRQQTPPPVWATDIVIARQMYVAALSLENLVSRFLIIYSAVAVFASFKLGSKGSTQKKIDQILLGEDPGIAMKQGHKGRETEFTGARNDFLHAEDRGRNPSSALNDARVRMSVGTLTADELRILRWLSTFLPNQGQSVAMDDSGALSMPDQRGLDGLLRRGCEHAGSVRYSLTPLGYALATTPTGKRYHHQRRLPSSVARNCSRQAKAGATRPSEKLPRPPRAGGVGHRGSSWHWRTDGL